MGNWSLRSIQHLPSTQEKREMLKEGKDIYFNPFVKIFNFYSALF